MKQNSTSSTMKTNTVAVSTLSAKSTAVVNTQPSNTAPDASGKTMKQYEVLVGNGPNMYLNTYVAHVAVQEAAAAEGCSNYAVVPNLTGAYAILAW